jgi:hypothetical protein
MNAKHSAPVRGLTSTPNSPHFQVRFGRMFRSLPGATFGKTDVATQSALTDLAKQMTSGEDAPRAASRAVYG